jgi:hypothetical protein
MCKYSEIKFKIGQEDFQELFAPECGLILIFTRQNNHLILNTKNKHNSLIFKIRVKYYGTVGIPH